LIGVALNNTSKLGVMGHYFKEIKGEEKKYEWNPHCYFGHVDD